VAVGPVNAAMIDLAWMQRVAGWKEPQSRGIVLLLHVDRAGGHRRAAIAHGREHMGVRSRDSVSEKIDHLFHTVRRQDGREYTYDDVEQGTGGRVSRSYVWKLRHGRNRNPSLDVIEALGEFFRVPPTYFFGEPLPDDETAREAAEVAALLQDTAVRTVAEHARGLSPQALQTVVALIDNLKSMGAVPHRGQRAAAHG